jgi:hypothetical protein
MRPTAPHRMKKAAAFAVVLGIAAWVVLRLAAPVPEQAAQAAAEKPPPTAADRLSQTHDSDAPSVPPAHVASPPPAATLATMSAADIQRVHDAIDNLDFAFRDHAAALGGNPVGTNAEITAALRGDNARQLAQATPTGSSISAAGELLDPWDTPWFFHQLSANKMEVRSAGPDRQMYTEDDFVR